MKKALIALGAAVLILAIAPPAFSGHTFTVDDDGLQCPGATHSTIQSAVLAADPGTKIEVCAGTYTGTVPITVDDIHLVAKHPPAVILDGLGTTTEDGFSLQNVSGVLIEGFTVRQFRENILLDGATNSIVRKNVTHSAHHDGLLLRNSSSGNLLEQNESFGNVSPNGCGLSVLSGSSDNVVIKNEFHGNVFRGIQLVGAGPDNHLKDNVVRDNGVANTVFGPPYPGAGIANLNTAGTVIDDNVVRNNAGHGVVVGRVVVDGPPSTQVTVKDNLVFQNGSGNDHDGIRLADGSSLNEVVNNRSERNRHDGVHLLDAHLNVVRDNSIITNGTNPGPELPNNGCGIDVEVGSRNNTIRNNDVEGHDRAAIRLRGSAPSTAPTMNLVVENDVEENMGFGILLEEADVNTLRSNDSKKNGNDGLHANAASAGNTFELNDMAENAARDCRDDSAGPGTAGTANTWTENDGKTQNRLGLCKDAQVT